MKKKPEQMNLAKVARSDGALGLGLILQAVEHYIKYRDNSLLLSRLKLGTNRDFNRLKQIVETSTNLKVAGQFNKPSSINIAMPSKIQTNEVFDRLKALHKKGDVSFRSKKLDKLVGQIHRTSDPNFSTVREITNLISRARTANENPDVIKILEKCWLNVKLLSQ